MPQVPVYQQKITQNAEPANQLKVNYQAPEGVSKVVNQGVDLAGKAYEQASIAKANEGFIEYSKLHEELLNGKGDGDQSGLFQQRGFNALNAAGKYQEDYEKRKSEILTKYDGIGRERLEKLIEKDYLNDQKRISRHLSEQAQNYQDEQMKSLVGLQTEKAMANYQDPELFAAYKAQALDTYEKAAQLKGIPKEGVEIGKKTLSGQMQSQLISKLNEAGRSSEARLILDENKDTMPVEIVNRLEKELKIKEQLGTSMKLADEFERLSYSAQQAKLKEIEDPEIRKGVRDEISARRRDFEAEQNFRRNQAKSIAVRQMLQNGYKFASLSPSLLATLDASDISSLRSMSNKAGEVKSDWTLYSDITKSLSQEGGKSKYANFDPMAYADKLAEPELKRIIDLSNSIKNGDKSVTNKVVTLGEIKDAALSSMKIDQKKNPEKATEYLSGLENYIEQESGGKELKPSEMEEMARKYNTKIILNKKSYWYNEELPANKIDFNDKSQIDAVDIDDIPEEDKAKIQASSIYKNAPDKSYAMKKMFLKLHAVGKGK